MSNKREYTKQAIKRLVVGGLMLAISILLPQIFHLAGGPASGAVFLPMHIPVLVTGFVLGPLMGFIVGILSPLISFLMTGMPPSPRLPFMIVELATYGWVAGFIYHTLRARRLWSGKKEGAEQECTLLGRFGAIFITLLSAMIIGRIVFAVSLVIQTQLFGIENAGPASVWLAVSTGFVGIIIQIIVIPPIILALQKGGRIYGSSNYGKTKTD